MCSAHQSNESTVIVFRHNGCAQCRLACSIDPLCVALLPNEPIIDEWSESVDMQDAARRHGDKLKADLDSITEKGTAVVRLNNQLMAQIRELKAREQRVDGAGTWT